MTPVVPEKSDLVIRPVQYRDLEAVEQLLIAALAEESGDRAVDISRPLELMRQWYVPLKVLSLFPKQLYSESRIYVAEQNSQIVGLIQVSPFNSSRSTWRIEYVTPSIGTQLLRYCFETVWEARTWLLEVNVSHAESLSLYRQNGFQPLAQMTYWAISPEQLSALSQREPDLPNLLPVSNADAGLVYQLDTAAMPPLVRQVFDRHIHDFKTGFLRALVQGTQQWLGGKELVSGYVFEPQRKAAIGYYQVWLSRDGSQPHLANLTVHPAYTWLYPELLTQMARITQARPPAVLHLTSADYQPEREAFLEQIEAERIEHTLMMSRSVWHKVRESKSLSLEGLQLSEMLQGFQQNRKPVPGRMMFLSSWSGLLPSDGQEAPEPQSSGAETKRPRASDRTPEPHSYPSELADHDPTPG